MPSNVIIDDDAIVGRRIAVSEMDNNVYLLTSKRTGAQVLIDAADEPEAIMELLGEASGDAEEPHLDLIVTTHSHWDHIRALGEIVARTEATTAAGVEDRPAIEREVGCQVDWPLAQGDVLAVSEPFAPGGARWNLIERGAPTSADLTLDVIGLSGHTPGSVALAYTPADGSAPHLFTGDSLFPGGVGNTDGDRARFASLLSDVRDRLFGVYPDATIVHPGHGTATTLGVERPHLDEWKERGW
ncbi:MAG: MBL fold metallo-hydrolase [Propionibacteriaceae bacterium]|jgi:glyoxylase-like metal-dependent hydrolase (beta-lactamase superfamily II)|nr:MBL fold metallo-hydrolase [Propionibacteriaceae bacterium]